MIKLKTNSKLFLNMMKILNIESKKGEKEEELKLKLISITQCLGITIFNFEQPKGLL